MADGSDESLVFARQGDLEDMDIELVQKKRGSTRQTKNPQVVFLARAVLTTTSYTSHMRSVLSTPQIFAMKTGLHTIGSSHGPSDDVINYMFECYCTFEYY